jgi:hypothetical protein
VLELKIKIAREAVSKNVIGGLIAFESPATGRGKIDRDGKRQEQNAKESRGEDAGLRCQVSNLLTARVQVICETCSNPA